MAEEPKRREVKIRVHDGVEIAVALYMPDGDGPFPVVLGAAPYRYDNNSLPASPQFLWRETGPISLYVARGYVCPYGCARLRQIRRRIPLSRP
jgi:predicted acyl esterase